MEANFSLGLDSQIQTYEEWISLRRLKHIFVIKDTNFMKGVQLLFGLEYLDDFWKRRSNLDVASLFVVLALLVGKIKR